MKAGQITIDINAGTAKMVLELEQAKGKLREFGSSGISETKAMRAGFKALEGDIFSNSRAAEQFAEKLLGLGNIAKFAFPLIGGVAFAGMLVEVGEKVYKLFEELEQGPEKANAAFASLRQSVTASNNELELTNAKLERDIAKLEGKPQNNLAIALAEAKVAADKLSESLEKDLNALNKLLKEHELSAFTAALSGLGSDEIQRVLGGVSGVGGAQAELRRINAEEGQQLDAVDKKAKNAKEQIKAITDAAIEARRKLLEQINAAIDPKLAEAERQSKPKTGQSVIGTMYGVAIPGGQTTIPGSELAKGQAEDFKYAKEVVSQEFRRLNEWSRSQNLTDRKEEDTGKQEAINKALAERKRLTDQLFQSQQALRTELERINEEEKRDIANLSTRSAQNVETIHQTADNKRLKVYNDELAKQAKQLEDITKQNDKLLAQFATKSFEHQTAEIKANNDALKAHGEEILKQLAVTKKQTDEAGKMALQHRINMLSINGGDPVAVLALEQEQAKADIEERYQNSLKNANTDLEKANLQRERTLQLQALQYQMEEKIAQTRQKGVGDFFQEMQRTPESAGHVAYDGLTSTFNGFTDEFSKMLTGQRTSWGHMFQSIGEQMVKDSMKALLQRGIGDLSRHFSHQPPPIKKPTGNTGDPIHVWQDNPGNGQQQVPAGNSPSIGGGQFGAGWSGGMIFSMLSHSDTAPADFGVLDTNMEDVSSSIQYMANGGDVLPDHPYIVGEREPELFTPRTAGAITPMSKMGGDTFQYSIDARGADLGSSNRVARAIEIAHQSAVSNSVRSVNERHLRTPQRKK